MYIDFLTNFNYHVHMSPKSNKTGIKSYRPVLSEEARDAFAALAESLHFIVDAPSLYTGKPSAPDLLEALAECHRLDPPGTTAALAALLAAHGLLPEPPDA